MRLAAALWWFWYAGGHCQEGRDHLEAALAVAEQAQPAPSNGRAAESAVLAAARANALLGVGVIAVRRGSPVAARAALERCVALAWRLGAARVLAYGLSYLGLASMSLPDRDVAGSLHEESVALFRTLGDRWGLALALSYLGQHRLFQQDDTVGARQSLEERAALFRALGDNWGLGGTVSTQGMLRLRQDDLAGARPYLEESLALKREADDPWRLALGLAVLGALLVALGEESQALPLLEEALALHREQGRTLDVAFDLSNLGHAALLRSDPGPAAEYFAQSMALFRGLRDATGGGWAVGALGAAGALAGAAGEAERAVVLFGAAEAVLQDPQRPLRNTPMEAIDRRIFERHLETVRARMDASTFAAAHARGRALSLTAATALAGWD